jgi:drug/metabolite transporter (DMT)-like permease
MTRRWRRAAVSAVLGLAGPLVLYYALRALGLSVFTALLVGALVPVVGLVVDLLRGRRPDTVSSLWSVLLLLALGVSLIGGESRH